MFSIYLDSNKNISTGFLASTLHAFFVEIPFFNLQEVREKNAPFSHHDYAVSSSIYSFHMGALARLGKSEIKISQSFHSRTHHLSLAFLA
jgi:hypothetical protein